MLHEGHTFNICGHFSFVFYNTSPPHTPTNSEQAKDFHKRLVKAYNNGTLVLPPTPEEKAAAAAAQPKSEESASSSAATPSGAAIANGAAASCEVAAGDADGSTGLRRRRGGGDAGAGTTNAEDGGTAAGGEGVQEDVGAHPEGMGGGAAVAPVVGVGAARLREAPHPGRFPDNIYDNGVLRVRMEQGLDDDLEREDCLPLGRMYGGGGGGGGGLVYFCAWQNVVGRVWYSKSVSPCFFLSSPRHVALSCARVGFISS